MLRGEGSSLILATAPVSEAIYPREMPIKPQDAISRQQPPYWQRFEPGIVAVCAILLAPLLVAQGLITRRSVPKLPEPPGERDGRQGDGPPLRLLILGDSAAAGVGAAHQDEALLGQVIARLVGDFELTWRLLARTGNTTAAVLELLEHAAPQRFDIAITSLGVNDVTGLVGRNRWRQQQARLREMLKDKFGVERLLISGLPPLHGFPALPQPLRWVLGSRATLFNRDLEHDVAGDDAVRFIDLRFTADTTLMASDGFHPGPGVYKEWAERVAAHAREASALSVRDTI